MITEEKKIQKVKNWSMKVTWNRCEPWMKVNPFPKRTAGTAKRRETDLYSQTVKQKSGM